MGPHQQVTQHQRTTQRRRDQGRERFGRAQQKAGQKGETGSECRSGQQHRPAPPGEAVDRRQDDFGQPLVWNPSCAGERIGKRVVHRQRHMGEHPAACGDMEVGVGIVEQRHGLGERANEKGETDDQRPGRHQLTFSRHPVKRPNTGEKSLSDPEIDRLHHR